MSSEARRQIELPVPPALRTIEGPHIIELDDGVAERIDAYRGADAADPVAVAAEEPGPRIIAGPCGAGVSEHRHFHRKRAVVRAPAEQSEQREAQLRVHDGHARTDQLVEAPARGLAQEDAVATIERLQF